MGFVPLKARHAGHRSAFTASDIAIEGGYLYNHAMETTRHKPTGHAPPATITREGGGLILAGRLDSRGTSVIWKEGLTLAGAGECAFIDLSRVSYLDTMGAGLILRMRQAATRGDAQPPLTGTNADHERLLALFDGADLAAPTAPRRGGFVEQVGDSAVAVARDFKDLVTFVGEGAFSLLCALRSPSCIRWKDTIATCESAGVNALPIIALIGFLMGLITAFQSAVPMQRFGADIYVANLLGLSMLRELGPLVTAILLAGRSGSAFAAEIGTMVINEEVDALRTMGLDPIRFLMVPRVLGTLLIMPVLTIFFNFFALIGGGIVVTGLGYPLITYATRVFENVTTGDVLGGLFKALIFSILVAGIGCQRGLRTGSGASAVGISTTSSVVSGLVLIAVADGILATIYYALGI